jgi:hypothetical protein
MGRPLTEKNTFINFDKNGSGYFGAIFSQNHLVTLTIRYINVLKKLPIWMRQLRFVCRYSVKLECRAGVPVSLVS